MSRGGVQGFQKNRLSQILAARRLTQVQLASMVDVSAATISKWRAGTQAPHKPHQPALTRRAFFDHREHTMSELVVIQLTVPQLQTMLDKAAEKASLAAANASGELWGASDLAAHYKVTPPTIYNWERQGRLPRRAAGTRWRKADVLRWDADRAGRI